MLKVFETGNALVTIWRGEPTAADVTDSLVAAQKMRARTGRPVALIGVLAPDARMPNEQVRRGMEANWPKLIECASTMQYVVMPRGQSALDHLVSSRLFSLLVGVYALAKTGKQVSVHRKLEDAVTEAASVESSINQSEVARLVTAALK